MDKQSIKNYNWKIICDSTHFFKQDIKRIWEVIISFDSLDAFFIVYDKNNLPNIKKDNNIWHIGNIFEGKLLNEYSYKAHTIKEKIYSNIKTIQLIIYFINGEIMNIKINLFQVTENNSTVVNIKIKNVSSNEETIISRLKDKIGKEIFYQNIHKKLEQYSEYLYQFESGIIQGSISDIWEIITDCNKLILIAPNNRCFVPLNINTVKVGDSVKIPFTKKGIEGYLEIKLDSRDNPPKLNQWTFNYSVLGGGPFKVVKQSILVKLTKINKQETQVSIFTKILEAIDMEIFKNLATKKKYVIESLKDYFENFSVPEEEDVYK